MRGTARARVMLELIPTPGLRDPLRGLPQSSSLGMALSGIELTVTVYFDEVFPMDRIEIAGRALEGDDLAAAIKILDVVRKQSGKPLRARVAAKPNFDLDKGFPYMGTYFAALAHAANAATGLFLEPNDLAILARLGNGRSTLSIPGGLAEWPHGNREDGKDSFGLPLSTTWDLRAVIGLLDTEIPPLAVPGLDQAFLQAYQSVTTEEVKAAKQLVKAKDLKGLGELVLQAGLRYHALLMASSPQLSLHSSQLSILEAARPLTQAGKAFPVLTLGRHVALICGADGQGEAVETLTNHDAVSEVLTASLGSGSELLKGDAHHLI